MKQALDQIKKELGQDAFILSGKEVKGKKVMGLFGKSYFEVTAAVDYGGNPLRTAASPKGSQIASGLLRDDGELDRIQDTFAFSSTPKKSRPTRGETGTVGVSVPAAPATEAAGESETDQRFLLEEIRQLRSMIQSIPRQVSLPRVPAVYQAPRFAHPMYEEVYLDLIARELDDELAFKLVDTLIKETKGKRTPSRHQLTRKIASCLSSRIHLCDDLIRAESATGQKVLAVVGPTGVGKTTTLAKLAARAVLEKRLKVGFVTVDTFRIAATEQLKTYAEIIDVPTTVVENLRSLSRAIQEFRDKDLILIDTAGRSPREMESLNELAETLNSLPGVQKVLLLSATTKRSDLIEIVEKYQMFDPSCVIFTKLDETRVYGPVLSQLVRSACPLAYVTVGQNVPKDILVPDAVRLVSLFQGQEPGRWAELSRSDATSKPASKVSKKAVPRPKATTTLREVIPNV